MVEIAHKHKDNFGDDRELIIPDLYDCEYCNHPLIQKPGTNILEHVREIENDPNELPVAPNNLKWTGSNYEGEINIETKKDDTSNNEKNP